MKVLGVLRLIDGREWSWEMDGSFRKFDTSKEQLPTEVLMDLTLGTNETGYELIPKVHRPTPEGLVQVWPEVVE